MKLEDAAKKERACYAGVFDRLPLLVVRGEGVYVWDSLGRRFLDFASGVAVNSVGHCHPKVVRAIIEQAGRLLHASNWVYTEPQLALAQSLANLTGLERVFITNSGTEAVEAALKLARSASGKTDFVAMEGSFHGRTFGALSATWPEKYRKPFEPLVPGTSFVPYNSVEAVEAALTKKTAAVIVEPIQGEAGVIVPDKGYLKALRDVTADKGVLLIADEIQTGFGRTGSMFAFQEDRIRPDIVCLAKGMGGGVAVGAVAYSGFDFKVGEHGGTMGGNPLACAAANAAVGVIRDERLPERAKTLGDMLSGELSRAGFSPRGRGLMMAVPSDNPRGLSEKLIQTGVLAIYSAGALRILPPLVAREEHMTEFVKALSEAAGLSKPAEKKKAEKVPLSELRLAQALSRSDSRVDPAVVAEIAELLPETDYKKYGVESANQFAEKLLLGEKKLSDCPEVDPEKYSQIMLILDEYFR